MTTSFTRTLFSTVISFSVGGFYFGQQTQDSLKESTEIEEVILHGVTDLAKDRKTPVAASNVKAAQISERLGNQEFPQILNSTPSVYATKGSGGFGDSQIAIRGFETRNIAVLINGMPINDSENGKVYFSAWTGLQDVTNAIQVQRGLGSSKLAIASAGGTLNIITRSADMKQGGTLRFGVGNDGYLKSSVAYNTGKSEKGWSASALFNRQWGNTWIENSEYNTYSYFFALGFQPNEKHNFQFLITSAPEWHEQRYYSPSLTDYIRYNPKQNGRPFIGYNPDWGTYTADGKTRKIANNIDYFAEAIMMLNWDFKISERSKLSSVLYRSNGRGGGIGDSGKVNGKGIHDYVDASGHFDYNQIFAANALVNPETEAPGSTLIRRASINSHSWHGILANFQHELNENWNFSIGTDDRYYFGYHYQQANDFLGASAYKDNANHNLSAPNIVRPGQIAHPFRLNWNPIGSHLAPLNERIGYSYKSDVVWYSAFGQVEYATEKLSAFIQASASNEGYQRTDHFVKDGVDIQSGQTVNTKTGYKYLFGYDVKGGANFNIDEHHNVFTNLGHYSKQPFLKSVYPLNQQIVNPELTNEKVNSIEFGYGYRSADLNLNVNLYRTQWKDRWLRTSNQVFTLNDGSKVGGYSEIQGITEIHQGIELEANYRPVSYLELNGNLSLGDYFYKGNAKGRNYQNDNTPISNGQESILYLQNVKVGGADGSIPQTTAFVDATVKPLQDLRVYGTWRYAGNIYSSLNVSGFDKPGNKALGLPSFSLFDLGGSYTLRLKEAAQYFTFGVNVYNLFDKIYIENGTSSKHIKTLEDFNGDQQQLNDYLNNPSNFYKGLDASNTVFFGSPRTWSASMSFHF